MATYTAQVERDDLRLFFNACLSATAQAERDATWYEQRLALDFLHEYMRVNYRALYAKMLALPINDFNRQQILYGLLRHPVPQTHPENPLIFQALLRLPVHRVYKVFARLAEDRVNNRRTRQIIRAYVAHRNNLHFDLIKYRRLLRQILRHVHYPLSAEAYTFLFHKAWRQKVYTEPLFETFRQAHFSEKAIYQLPYTIAEGLAQRKGIPRERFLKHIRAQLSTQEAWRLQNTLGQSEALHAERMGLMDIVLYGLAQDEAGQQRAEEHLQRYFDQAKPPALARCLLPGQQVIAVLDNSFSASGSRERKHRPLATALALHLYLNHWSRLLGFDYQAFWTHPPAGDFENHPFRLTATGPTGLASPFIEALQREPRGIIVVSDGVENHPAGGVAWVLRQVKPSPWLVHLNPVWNPMDYQPRTLSPAMVTLGVRDVEALPLLLHLAPFFQGQMPLAELLSTLEDVL